MVRANKENGKSTTRKIPVRVFDINGQIDEVVLTMVEHANGTAELYDEHGKLAATGVKKELLNAN